MYLSEMISKLVLWFMIGLFGLGSLFPGTDVEEVMKLPALFGHYLEHQAESTSGVSILDFLAQHYGADAADKHQGDNHNHDNLPMVKHACSPAYWVLQQFHFELKQSETCTTLLVIHQSYLVERHSDQVIDTWPQPPQQA